MKTITKILPVFCFLFQLSVLAQNNSLQLGDGVITMRNGAFININQSSTDGITRNAGYICSDGETNRIAWKTNNNTGTYTIPFGSPDGDYMPLKFKKTTGGTPASADASVIVSTYHTASNNQPYPSNSNGFFSNVTNVNNISGTDNSANMIDRFWLVCFNNYTVNPSLDLTLGYDANGIFNDLNSLSAANLLAQYWNGSSWDPQLRGTANAGNNEVNSITGVNYNAPWALVNKIFPLPVDLISFNAACNGNDVLLTWSTATETNNDYFTIARSTDMINWSAIENISAAGNSNDIRSYSLKDTPTGSNNYYRLKQTDFDGTSVTYDPVSVNCKEEENLAFGNILQLSSNAVTVEFSGIPGEKYSIEMFDITGRLITTTEGEIIQGTNQVNLSSSDAAKAIFLVVLTSSDKRITKKVVM